MEKNLKGFGEGVSLVELAIPKIGVFAVLSRERREEGEEREEGGEGEEERGRKEQRGGEPALEGLTKTEKKPFGKVGREEERKS